MLHLNLHTDRSQNVGLIKPKQLVEWCVKQGIGSAAITDHDNMCAAIELYDACKKAKIKPIYGMEVSVCADKTRRERGSSNLVLLAKNREGFRNLIALATVGSMYFYYRPRIDLTDLSKYGEGLIGLTACLYGLTAKAFFTGGEEAFQRSYDELHAIFGNDLYLEMQPAAKDTQRVYNNFCIKHAKANGTQLVITGDPHYYAIDDRHFHEMFMRLKVMDKDGKWVYPFAGDYHLRTWDEMHTQFADLHGYDVSMVPEFKQAFEMPESIAAGIDCYDVREGVRLPTYFV
jgi:DNA polymerase-3 subunit alpha